MNLILSRHEFTDLSTIGSLRVANQDNDFCDTLELSCRRENALGKLAIPAGKYKVIIAPTAIGHRFKPPLPKLPLLVNVPGRSGIRIHPANKPTELEGCIAVGVYDPKEPDWIFDSRSTFDKLFAFLQTSTDDIWINVIGGLAVA